MGWYDIPVGDPDTPRTLVQSWNGSTWTIVPSPDLDALVEPLVGMASTPTGDGYRLADPAADVTPHGGARSYGSLSGVRLNAPVGHIVATPDGGGYWLVATDGGVFSFAAPFFGAG